ncbi:hypothetical protein [uncultured Cohaesibacter sp.]|uniref:hypothetical protein n=1 Tax=uncultured Cohaesibacter sp. TaxID=1002546 RepID=UPI0029C99537|nr:hypothetical protein [uncultured Cohaesibacter sp.]
MTDDQPSDEVLSDQVRRDVMAGASLWSMIAFAMLGFGTALCLAMTILHGIDMVVGMASFMPMFNKLVYSDPSLLPGWVPEVVTLFDAARGGHFVDPISWSVLGVLALLLYFAHLTRFSKPHGQSLTENEASRPVAKRMLKAFGYFRDIKVVESPAGVAGNDFLAKGRVLFVPKGHVTRILKGKASDLQQRTVRFFMVHEFAHTPLRDNLVASAFVVIVSIYAFVVLSSLSPLILISATLLVSGPFGVLIKLVLQLMVIGGFAIGLALSFQGVVTSYYKAREFFADQAAFRFAPDVEEPYPFSTTASQPDMLSAISADITPFERGCHRQGYSLHARNLLIYFWGLVIAVRTLYVLVAPKALCSLVLIFDVVALSSFVIFYATLPKRPPVLPRRPLLPWLIAFLGVTAVEVSGPALAGVVKSFYWDFFSDFNAQLIGLPGALVAFVLLVGCLVMAGKRIIRCRREGIKTRREIWREIGLRLLMVPGTAIEYVLIFALIGAFYSAYVRYFLALDFLDGNWRDAGLTTLFCGAGLVLLYNQYKGLFVFHRYRSLIVTGVEVVVFFLLALALQLSSQELIAATEKGEVMALPSLADIIVLSQTGDWSEALLFAVISSSFYLMLRVLGFWAWRKLHQVKPSSGQVRHQ